VARSPPWRIQANPTALASYGINLEDVRNALAGNSLNSAKGNFDGPAQDYTINANDQLLTSAAYKSVVVAYRQGAPIMLSDVAHVVDGVENERLARVAEHYPPAVIVNIQRQPGANTISVVDSIQKLLPQLESTLPRAIHVQVVTDRTTSIRAFRSVTWSFELLLAVALGRDGDIPLPAQPRGDHHSKHRGATVSDRYIRRYVPGRIQPQTTSR